LAAAVLAEQVGRLIQELMGQTAVLAEFLLLQLEVVEDLDIQELATLEVVMAALVGLVVEAALLIVQALDSG